MKVLIINGSPHKDGNTMKALEIVEEELNYQGIDTVTVSIGTSDIRGCIACNYCKENHKCAFDDIVNETAELFKECDGILIGTPVYYSGMNGTLKAFLDRLFNLGIVVTDKTGRVVYSTCTSDVLQRDLKKENAFGENNIEILTKNVLGKLADDLKKNIKFKNVKFKILDVKEDTLTVEDKGGF